MSENLLAGTHPSFSRRGAPPKRRAAAATAAATEENPAFPAEIGTKDENWTCMFPAPKLGGAQLCLQILSGGHPPRRSRRSPKAAGAAAGNAEAADSGRPDPQPIDTTQGEETWTESLIAWTTCLWNC